DVLLEATGKAAESARQGVARSRAAGARRKVAERGVRVRPGAGCGRIHFPSRAGLRELPAVERGSEARVDRPRPFRRAVRAGVEERAGVAETAALDRALAAEGGIGHRASPSRAETHEDGETNDRHSHHGALP